MDPVPRDFRPWAFLAVAWAVNVSINAFYIAPAPVFVPMIEDLGISKAQAGSLISAYLLSILAFQLPAGYVIDRADPRKIVPLAALALLATAVGMTALPSYAALLGLRILAGIPVAFVFVPSAFLVSRAFARTPGRAVGVFLSAPPAGVALGNLLGPFVAAAWGWPAVFAGFALPLVVLVPLFVLVSRGFPPRDHEAFGLGDFLRTFRHSELWKIGLAFASSYAAYIFFSSWTPTYLKESGVLDAAAIGLLSASIPAAGILSRPLGGYLAETRAARDKRWVPGVAFVLSIGVSAGIPFLGAGAAPLLVAAGFLAQFPFSVYYLFSAQVLPEKFRGTAFAFMNTASLIGGAIAPALAGFLADVTGSFLAAFAMIAGNAVLGLALVARVRER